ncbi:hypothetical protein BH23ACT9_BH23ACT9_32630 [soil metagenome]
MLSQALRADVDRMIDHEASTRLGDDIEALHQMRVSTRRLHSTLRTFQPVLDRSWARDLRGRLRGTAAALGDVRDLDVLLERLDAESVDGSDTLAEGIRAIHAVLEDRRGQTRTRLLEVLDDPGHAVLLHDLLEAAAAPHCLDPEPPAGLLLPPLITKAWHRLRRAEGSMPLHDVRIRAKRLRYAAEAAESAFGSPARKLAKAAGRAQKILGKHQDAVVARATYLSLLPRLGTDPATAFALGVLVAREEARRDGAADAWPAVWKGVRVVAKDDFWH